MPVILAYHGCSAAVAQALVDGMPFEESPQRYDWLGRGIYLWEADLLRAFDWALARQPHQPSVVGAAIELGSCLDLTSQLGLRAVRDAYDDFARLQSLNDKPMPMNRDSTDTEPGDMVIRNLDRAVIDHLNARQDALAMANRASERFQTIWALFPEGRQLYPDAGFRELTHIQICVRDPRRILGVFRIPEHQQVEFNLTSLYR